MKQYLKRYDIRAIVDERNEKIGRKIRDNEMKRIPYMLVVGDYSNRGKLLYNQITQSLDSMGHAISEQEKRQIIMEILQKLC